jgi:hypothetical protein
MQQQELFLSCTARPALWPTSSFPSDETGLFNWRQGLECMQLYFEFLCIMVSQNVDHDQL